MKYAINLILLVLLGCTSLEAKPPRPCPSPSPCPSPTPCACPPTAPVVGAPIEFQLYPQDNWWNQDVSSAPLDPNSNAFISFIGIDSVHTDWGTEQPPDGEYIYGLPYIVVGSSQPKREVSKFLYDEESDHVGYPIPDEAITNRHWIECGPRGNLDLRSTCDRHMIILDKDNKYLYELYNVWFNGSSWEADSGAFFDLNVNYRRPEGWTSADAAGLAMLPGLVRYDEVYGPGEINHAIRFTVRMTNGYVWPASHRAGNTVGALPMGARLRLKAGKDISYLPPDAQKIARAMKKYGLIVADNGSDMYITGMFDNRWNMEPLHDSLSTLNTNDFEVIVLGWKP